jgi:hypothetical protein
MNRVYATLLVVLVVLCQIISAQSEKTHIGDLSSAQIEEQIQVGPLSLNARYQLWNSILILSAMSSRPVSQRPQGFDST